MISGLLENVFGCITIAIIKTGPIDTQLLSPFPPDGDSNKAGALAFMQRPLSFITSRANKALLSLRSPASTAAAPLGGLHSQGQRPSFWSRLRSPRSGFCMSAAAPATSNPLLNLGLFPSYDNVDASHVVPAIKELVEESRNNLKALEADLANGVVPASDLFGRVERLGDKVGRAWGVVNHLKGVKDTEPLRTAVSEVQPLVVSLNLEVAQSDAIYKAWKKIQGSPSEFDALTEAQQTIIKNEIRDAELTGVALPDAQKEEFNGIQQRLAQLNTNFSNNVLDGTKAYSVRITDKARVAGLPESALALAAQTATKKGDAGATPEDGPWVFTLDGPAFMPIQQYAADRALREETYRAFVSRASDMAAPGGGGDNTPLIREILNLRQKKAELLGYKNFAEVSCASKMATPEEALALMDKLRESAMEPAKKEREELVAYAKTKGFEDEMMPWDEGYYAELYRQEKLAFNEEDLRPYLSLPAVLKGMFGLAKRLFDVDVTKVTDAPPSTWSSDVEFFEIKKDGKPVAYFYLDPYSRPDEKRGGAWMDECAARSKAMGEDGNVRLPVAHMVCNQSPPVGDTPSLMTIREVETLFHEFGHALQHMLTKQDDGLVAGIRGIPWDAVELPSQWAENWCYDKKTMDTMALHYKTNELIPSELWERLLAAKNYRAASRLLRQLQFSVSDLTLHQSALDDNTSPHDVYRNVAAKYLVKQPLEFDRFLCGFSHIFAGGYAAGYFSYKWAEVLSADAFAAFEEVGLDNEDKVRETGARFRDTVLAMGGGRDASKVFVDFRGRAPNADALLRHEGLLVGAK